MNPKTNRFEPLKFTDPEHERQQSALQRKLLEHASALVRPDGSPVPGHWAVFAMGENVVIKGYTFKVAYVGETSILFEPVAPEILPDDES